MKSFSLIVALGMRKSSNLGLVGVGPLNPHCTWRHRASTWPRIRTRLKIETCHHATVDVSLFKKKIFLIFYWYETLLYKWHDSFWTLVDWDASLGLGLIFFCIQCFITGS